MSGLEEMSREELVVLVRRQSGQITALAEQVAELMDLNEALAGKLARGGASAVAQLGELLDGAVEGR